MPVDLAPALHVGRILAAVRSHDQARVSAVLDDAEARHGADTTIDEVVFPTLRVVGTFWSSGTLDIAHEQVLSRAVTRWLAGRSAVLPAPTRTGTILLAAGPRDQHTLALDCLDLLLSTRGVEVCNLGAQAPVASLLHTARSIHPTAVVLSSHTPAVTAQAVRSVRAIAEAGLAVYFAGSSFASQFVRRQTPGIPLDGSLRESAALLAARHTEPVPELAPPPRALHEAASISA